MAFVEKKDRIGRVVKATIRYGRGKEITFTPFHGTSYVHLNDMRKNKSTSLSFEEVQEAIPLLERMREYHESFKQLHYEPISPPSGVVRPVDVPSTTPTRLRGLSFESTPERPGAFQVLQGQLNNPDDATPSTSSSISNTLTGSTSTITAVEQQQLFNFWPVDDANEEELFVAVPITLPQ